MEKLVEKAKGYLKYFNDEAFVESKLWAQRDSNTGIRHIVEAIAKSELGI